MLRSGLCQRSGQKFCGGASTRYAYISSLANLDLKNRCCSYACQKRCQRHQCHWLEARWRFSMSIIQDDFTGAIVSRRSSIKRTPPLGSSSSHQLSLSRTIKEPFRLLGHGVKGGQSIYTPQVTHCAISPLWRGESLPCKGHLAIHTPSQLCTTHLLRVNPNHTSFIIARHFASSNACQPPRRSTRSMTTELQSGVGEPDFAGTSSTSAQCHFMRPLSKSHESACKHESTTLPSLAAVRVCHRGRRGCHRDPISHSLRDYTPQKRRRKSITLLVSRTRWHNPRLADGLGYERFRGREYPMWRLF